MSSGQERLEKSAQELWQDYWFLTKEMAKFLDKQDIDLFLEIMEQRERLQTIIEKTTKNNLVSSPEEQSVSEEICKINDNMKNKLRYFLNDAQKRHDISRAYDGLTSFSAGKQYG